MILVRPLPPEEFGRVVRFYRENNYEPPVSSSDVIVVAENEGGFCGALRLCCEQDALVLRGMRVSASMRGRGVGTLLLQSVEELLAGKECFCIPHRHLVPFYGRIGFEEIDAAETPSFLRKRREEYRREYGLDVVIMRRSRQEQ